MKVAKSDVSSSTSGANVSSSSSAAPVKPFSFVDRDLERNRLKMAVANKEQTERTRNIGEFTKMLRSYPSNESVVKILKFSYFNILISTCGMFFLF